MLDTRSTVLEPASEVMCHRTHEERGRLRWGMEPPGVVGDAPSGVVGDAPPGGDRDAEWVWDSWCDFKMNVYRERRKKAGLVRCNPVGVGLDRSMDAGPVEPPSYTLGWGFL